MKEVLMGLFMAGMIGIHLTERLLRQVMNPWLRSRKAEYQVFEIAVTRAQAQELDKVEFMSQAVEQAKHIRQTQKIATVAT
jgi:hypothetical protein